MSYSDFTLEQVVEQFNLGFIERIRMWEETQPINPSAWLRETIDFNLPIAVAIGSEKARSELLIAPVILEMKRKNSLVSIFSGREFNVDVSKGLNGFVDFLISKAPQQSFIGSPVVVLVEAKRGDLSVGYGQCAAEMVAAQIKNQKADNDTAILGIITSGTVWQFMRLYGQALALDLAEYSLGDLPLILGILQMFTKED
jgi:hypothetical protein